MSYSKVLTVFILSVVIVTIEQITEFFTKKVILILFQFIDGVLLVWNQFDASNQSLNIINTIFYKIISPIFLLLIIFSAMIIFYFSVYFLIDFVILKITKNIKMKKSKIFIGKYLNGRLYSNIYQSSCGNYFYFLEKFKRYSDGLVLKDSFDIWGVYCTSAAVFEPGYVYRYHLLYLDGGVYYNIKFRTDISQKNYINFSSKTLLFEVYGFIGFCKKCASEINIAFIYWIFFIPISIIEKNMNLYYKSIVDNISDSYKNQLNVLNSSDPLLKAIYGTRMYPKSSTFIIETENNKTLKFDIKCKNNSIDEFNIIFQDMKICFNLSEFPTFRVQEPFWDVP